MTKLRRAEVTHGCLCRCKALFDRFLQCLERDAGELLETGAVYAEDKVGGWARDLLWADGVPPAGEGVDDLGDGQRREPELAGHGGRGRRAATDAPGRAEVVE